MTINQCYTVSCMGYGVFTIDKLIITKVNVVDKIKNAHSPLEAAMDSNQLKLKDNTCVRRYQNLIE